MAKRTIEERTCPECGFVAKNLNGLRGHRQFKHGIRSSGSQLPMLEEQPVHLITDEVFEQRMADAIEMLDTEIERQVVARLGDAGGATALHELQARVDKIDQETRKFADTIRAKLSTDTGGLSHQLQQLTAAHSEVVRKLQQVMAAHDELASTYIRFTKAIEAKLMKLDRVTTAVKDRMEKAEANDPKNFVELPSLGIRVRKEKE